MYIAIDASRTTRATRTGTENYALNLIRALLQVDSSNHYTLYFRDQPVPDLFHSAPNCELRVIPFRRLWTHLRFAAALFRTHPDITFVPAHSLPFLFPGRAAVTIHDLGYLYFPKAHTRFSRWYLDLTTRFSAWRASVVIADSGATKSDLIQHYRVPPQKIKVIYPGVETLTRASTDQISEVRFKYGLPERYFLFLGTIQPRKNIKRLIEAYQQWRTAHPTEEIGLVLAGRRGWLTEDLPTDAPGVIVTGYIADADIAPLYSGALALTFPSLYEGFGFPVIEAMACGTPVLCSNTSSLPELAVDAALYVDPLKTDSIAAGLTRLVDDAALREKLIQRGYDQAARFSWRIAAQQVRIALSTGQN